MFLYIIGSERLGINGAKIVTNTDGSLIMDDELIPVVKNEILLLLEQNQNWQQFDDEKSNQPIFLPVNDPQPITERFFIVNGPEISNTTTSETNDDHLDENSSDVSNTTKFSSQSGSNQEYLWSNYKIPWDKLPNYVTKELESGLKAPQSVTILIHTIVNNMREIKTVNS